MKIGISTLSGLSYGGITYFNNILHALGRVDKNNKYVIFISEDGQNNFVPDKSNFEYVIIKKVSKNALLRFFWEQFILPFKLKKMNIDVFYTAKNLNIFLSNKKTVIAIRNMEPFFYKNYNNELKLNIVSWLRRVLTTVSMRKASTIIVVSKFVKDYLSENYINNKMKLRVVYNGNPISNQSQLKKNTKGIKYLLTASKFISYANQLSLLKGYNDLNNRIEGLPPLWFAGGINDNTYYKLIIDYVDKNNLNEKIQMLGLVEHSELINLYNDCYGFIFPSTLEACPHTLIEVMSLGIPMAVSNYDPMPEICGDSAIYFPPYDEIGISNSIERLLFDHKLRTQLKQASLSRSRFFNWHKSAKELVNVFEELA